MKKIPVQLDKRSYTIFIEKGLLHRLNEVVNVNRKVMMITDTGIPLSIVETVASQWKEVIIETVPQGEKAKSFEVYQHCLTVMLEHHFTRHDCVIALGGGVVGDLAGFVAASYMRGISFIQIPTTTLSQIDSSIGGKVAINVNGVKNCVGAFWQPEAVIIDPDTISSLPIRHINNGLVEALKAGLLANPRLVEIFESEAILENYEEILEHSLLFKKSIVEEDETEKGIRKILNFGHTFGHALESYYHLEELYHGEAVALGMLMVLENEMIYQKLKAILQRMNIKTVVNYDPDEIFHYLTLDKKVNQESVSLIQLNQLQQPKIVEVSLAEIRLYLKGEKR